MHLFYIFAAAAIFSPEQSGTQRAAQRGAAWPSGRSRERKRRVRRWHMQCNAAAPVAAPARQQRQGVLYEPAEPANRRSAATRAAARAPGGNGILVPTASQPHPRGGGRALEIARTPAH
jgi:hypothetical protein